MAWMRVTNELDIAIAPIHKQTLRLAEQQAARIVLDLRELDFMGCRGVHVILDAARPTAAGRQLVLVRGAPKSTRCSISPPPPPIWTSSTQPRGATCPSAHPTRAKRTRSMSAPASPTAETF